MPESDSSELFILTYKCPIDWDSMTGDDFTRHCDQCNHSVVNVSVSTKEQVDELFNKVREGQRACVRFDSAPEQTDRKVSTIRQFVRSALPNWSRSRSVRHAMVATLSLLVSAIKVPVAVFAQPTPQAPVQPKADTKNQDQPKKNNVLEVTADMLTHTDRTGQLGWMEFTNSELLQNDLHTLFDQRNGLLVKVKNEHTRRLIAKVKHDVYESRIIVLEDMLDLAEALTKDNSFVGAEYTLDVIKRSGSATDQTLARVNVLDRRIQSKQIDFEIAKAEDFTNEKQYEKAYTAVVSAYGSFRFLTYLRSTKREHQIRLCIANLRPFAPEGQQKTLDSLNKNLTNDHLQKDED